MTTKKRILDEALTLFAEKGYGNVYVGQIAETVGIKAPSLYKHYKSKQDIFNAILEEMKNSYDKQAGALKMNGSDVNADAPLSYQSAILAILCASGVLKEEDADVMALQFYAPIYMLLTICDRQPEREAVISYRENDC